MRIAAILVSVLVLLPLVACNEEPPNAPAITDDASYVDPELAGRQLMTLTGWPAMDEDGNPVAMDAPLPAQFDKCQITWIDRHVLAGDIAYYEARLRVGPGEYDVIGIHRVVRERRPGVPIRSRDSIMLLHGDIKDFEGMFLPGFVSPRQPDDWGLAVHLAQADIDVWGISQAWSLVPGDETDLSFMNSWGLQRQIVDLRTAIEVARVVRRQSGNGYRKMLLLGYSSGTATGFAYLAQESQLPPGHQKVNGYVAADYGLVSDFQPWRDAMCGDVGYYQALIDGGQPFTNPFVVFGPPAVADPDGPSELIPGFTNLQAAFALAVYPGYPAIPEVTYHFLAGVFDEAGTPVGLQYTTAEDWLDFMTYAPPYETALFMQEYSNLACDPDSGPWDDHLDDVRVPILWMEAAGGAAPMARHTLDVIASTDVTELVVSFHPPEEVLLDFAHIDLFAATNAPQAVWNPTRDWILAHSPH